MPKESRIAVLWRQHLSLLFYVSFQQYIKRHDQPHYVLQICISMFVMDQKRLTFFFKFDGSRFAHSEK